MMKLPILFKMFIGYIIILAMIVTVIVYAISQIDKLNSLSSVLLENNNITVYKEKLIYSLLTQMRYERKYIISKDLALYNQFLSAKNDFSKYLKELASVMSPTEKNKLDKIESYYKHYQFLTNEKIKKSKANKRYSQNWYKMQEDKVFFSI